MVRKGYVRFVVSISFLFIAGCGDWITYKSADGRIDSEASDLSIIEVSDQRVAEVTDQVSLDTLDLLAMDITDLLIMDTPDLEVTPEEAWTDIDCTDCECPGGFVPIPSGTFTMGSPKDEPGRVSNESQHEVTLTRGFCMKVTEVTNREWEAQMEITSSVEPCDECAVINVSWWDALAFCNKMSTNSGLPECYQLIGCSSTPGSKSFACVDVKVTPPGECTGFRLPTEAEWEYAARAGTTTATYGGTSTTLSCEHPNTVLDPIARFCGNTSNYVHPVAGLSPNAWGLHDMLGNVWEWTFDWYEQLPTESREDPLGPESSSGHVIRGGSWSSGACEVRSAARTTRGPTVVDTIIGFRPVRTQRCSSCSEVR